MSTYPANVSRPIHAGLVVTTLVAAGLALTGCIGASDPTVHGTLLDGSTPAGDGAMVGSPTDLAGTAGTDGAVVPSDGGVAGPVHTIKLSQSLYCPRMGKISPKLFYADQAAVAAAYDAWLVAIKAGGLSYAAPPLDVLGVRVRPGEQGGGSALTTAQLEGQKISCVRLNSTPGPGAFETTTLVPDPGGKPSCLVQGMDWGTDFHYSGATFPIRAACLGAPTTFAWTKNFDNDAFPTALTVPANGLGAYAVGDKTYAYGYSTGIWAFDANTPVGQRANKGSTYNMSLTATNGVGAVTTPQFKYRFVNIGDVVNGGSGGIARHPSSNTCLIKSAGERGNKVEGQVAYPTGSSWAMRVMLVPKPDGSPMQFELVLWADVEFSGIGPSVQPYAVISDLPCEFDQIVDGCYSDSVVISYYPGSPTYVTDLAAAKAQGRRYCGMRPGQIYYMNVRSQGWLGQTPADSCPAGQTCMFAAFLNQQ